MIHSVLVNLVTNPGTGSKELRVTGVASACPSNLVIVTSTVTAPSGPVPVNAQERFRVSLPVTGTVQCGDAVAVRVECSGSPTCFYQGSSQPVRCCEANVVAVQGVVPTGALAPTAVRVIGTLLGCYNDQVVVDVLIGTTVVGPSPAIQVDPFTGGFNVLVSIPPGVTLECDDTVTARAWCALDSTCRAERRVRLDCPGCSRAEVSYTAAPCSGSPPTQVVTLKSVICIPAGATRQFRWAYGDGALGPPFTVVNTTGTAATRYTFTEQHAYVPGNYTAVLSVVPPPYECETFPLPVTVQCPQCPAVSGSVTVGVCETDVASPNFGHRPVDFTLTFTPPIPQNANAWITWNYGGPTATGATSLTQQMATAGGPVAQWPHQVYLKHRPGGYASSATASVTLPGQACQPVNVQFAYPPVTSPPVIHVGSCALCPLRVDAVLTAPASLPCAPTTASLTFQASVVWPPGTVNPPSPASYDWTITLPGTSGRQAKLTGGATVDTSQGWTGNGATGTGAVDLTPDGQYAVGVTAKFASSAGLPTNQDGTSACNLTGSTSVTLPPCGGTVTPPCPSIAALTPTGGGCADPATGAVATLGFAATVQDPGNITAGYQWDFGDPASGPSNVATTQTPNATHTYTQPGTFTVTVTGNVPARCLTPQSQTTVAVPLCDCPPGQIRDASGNCVPATPIRPPQWPSWLCGIIFAIAMLTLATALIALFAFGCQLNVSPPGCPSSPTPMLPANTALLAVAIGAFVAFLIAIILWGIFCAASHCGVLCFLIGLVQWMIMVAAVATIVLSQLCNPCFLGAIFDGTALGVALVVLLFIADKAGCKAPVFPSFSCPP